MGVQAFTAVANQLVRVVIAKNFGIPLVAVHNPALANKHNTYPRTVEQGLLFTQRTLQRHASGQVTSL